MEQKNIQHATIEFEKANEACVQREVVIKMVNEFILEGLCCSGCATKIETAVNKLNWVMTGTVSLATTRLKIKTTADVPKNMLDIIKGIVHTYDPDIVVIVKGKDRNPTTERDDKKRIVWLSVGAVTFLIGMVIMFVNFDGEHLFEHMLQFNPMAIFAFILFAVSYVLLAGKVLIRMVRNISKGLIFDENFLMGVATLGAIGIDKLPEATGVMLFYQIGEFFQKMSVAKSKKRIGDLMDIRPDYANVKREGKIVKVDPETVQIDDLFVVKPGEKVPLDGIVVEGTAMLDTTALTGESVPRKATVSVEVLSGCINQNSVLTIRATKTFGDSTVSKILDLVENAADKKAPTETFITKFAKYYTPIVVFGALLLAVVPPLFFGGVWGEWIHRALIFLIISCPCALVLSIPMGFFGGIGSASKKGVLIKGGNYLEALAKLDFVIFDKTGTLTKGVFKVTDIQAENGWSEAELLEMTAHAEGFSNHPIALSILKEYGEEVDKDNLSNYEEIAGHGVSVRVNGRKIFAGNEKLMDRIGVTYVKSESLGTKVYVAIDNIYAGCIVISDEIKEDSYGLMTTLKKLGVRKTAMLTGDTPEIATSIAEELQLDEVYASLLPQEKVEKVELLNKQKQAKKTLAFIGDGINDAPVLAMADIGIAMGGLGSDAAIEVADIVLMTDEPAKLVEAIKVARFTKRIVWQNIVMTLSVQILFLYLATFGLSSLWEAVFADVGVSLLAVLNSRRILKI